ncbi:hypothetical protein ACFU90_04290 [Streptomyces noursei]|uniref:Uncharacterized protein n=1 Tax=Streptomyces noursei TaxID=1971 RepID=A0A401R9W1_STRNR|nr:hypothetical protein [Streptomyces noursei]UWS75125.1 hypothetical protein N1H47_30125 [Streptomyces noursei]GCB94380.1 hypothetical protein SALB_07179 [Streptomyces noursei]
MYTPHLKVDFYLKKDEDLSPLVGHAQFSGASDSGYWRFEKVFTGVKAGDDYKAGLFTANTEKKGGYWFASKHGDDSNERYTRVSNFRSSWATITLPS